MAKRLVVGKMIMFEPALGARRRFRKVPLLVFFDVLENVFLLPDRGGCYVSCIFAPQGATLCYHAF